MTLERKAWWDSLPKEERKNREYIDYLLLRIKDEKKLLRILGECKIAQENIRDCKVLIKALRKQIAMNPIVAETGEDDYIRCPVCCNAVAAVDTLKEFLPKHCCDCGQKLRWK